MNPNREKYPDPTAKKVERELTAEELEVSYLVKMIRQIAAWAGYDVVNRKDVPVVKCSKCKIYFCDLINNHHYMYHYCPNCGARMDGDGNA